MSLALALKYRPKNFDELIGQPQVVTSLKNALDSKRLSHAYLFSGLRGSGKTSTARIFAKALVCENGVSGNPCEKCDNCIMANENRHIDIIEMDAASHRKIDDIRDLIEQTRYKPVSARYKIFIIDEVHMLTKEAFNAFLKTLEEPPQYVKFILATTDPLKLPATVLSRTQHFRFKSIGKQGISAHLKFILARENIKYEDKAIEILARSGGGSLRDCLTMLDQAIIFSNSNITTQVISQMLGFLEPSKIDEIFDMITNADKSALIDIIKELQGYEAQTIINEMIAHLKEKFISKDTKFSLLLYERFFRILSQCKTMLSVNCDEEFVLLIMFFMMIEAMNLRSIDEMIDEIGSENVPFTSSKQTERVLQNLPKTSEIYEKFKKNLYERSYELGKCFDEVIEFVDFKDNVMMLNSHAKDKNQEILRKSSPVIMKILRQTCNEKTLIKIQSNLQTAPKNSAPLNETKQDLQTKTNLIKNETSPQISTKNTDESKLKELNKLFGNPEIMEES